MKTDAIKFIMCFCLFFGVYGEQKKLDTREIPKKKETVILDLKSIGADIRCRKSIDGEFKNIRFFISTTSDVLIGGDSCFTWNIGPSAGVAKIGYYIPDEYNEDVYTGDAMP